MFTHVYNDIPITVYNVNDTFTLKEGSIKKNFRSKKHEDEFHCPYPMAFDIETTKYFLPSGEERRAMFVWQFAVDTDYCIMGRTWEEFCTLLEKLRNDGRHFHIFVHNLTYETYHMIQILYEHFNGDWEIKLLNSMKVWEVKFENIHFHDSAVISMMSLEKTAKDYNQTYFKAKGDFDYDKTFSSATPLSDKEIGYCLLDVLSLTEYIDNMLAMYPNYNIITLPKTQTGFVRKDVLNKSKLNRKWRKTFAKLALSAQEYEACQKAFDGGYTAGSITHYGEYIINEDIRCRDITSSYPFQLLNGKYPMNKFAHYSWEDIENWDNYAELINTKCVIASYTFTNVHLICKEPRFSISRLDELGEHEAWNGKLISAEHFTRTMNEVTFMSFIKYYTFDKVCVDDIMVADKASLPDWLLEANLEYFAKKSTLKGVEGKEIEYMKGKQMLNGIYGMIATAIVREEWNLNINEMVCGKTIPDIQESLTNYYDSENSFLAYQWASYCTAYARKQVFDMMDICLASSPFTVPNTPQIDGGNWLYTDTDSVYYISNPQIEEAFELYNMNLNRQWHCTTSKGTITTLGEVTPDGEYCEFVQFGAKKYCKRECHKGERGELVITVAGVPKKSGVKVLKDSIFTFAPNLVFKGTDTGKLRPQYNFSEIMTVDVNGVLTKTASSVNLLPCDYKLSGIDEDVDEVVDNIVRNIDKLFTQQQRKEYGL